MGRVRNEFDNRDISIFPTVESLPPASQFGVGVAQVGCNIYSSNEVAWKTIGIDNNNTIYVVGDSFDVRAMLVDQSGSLLYNAHSIWHQTNTLMGGILNFLGIDGINGTGALSGATYYRDRLDAAIASGAHWIALRASVNDIHMTLNTLDMLVAEYSSLFSKINAAGIRIISNTIGPSSSYDTTSKREVWNRFNEWMLLVAPTLFDIVVIPQHWQILDDTVLTGTGDMTLSTDGVHPDLPGAYLIAKTSAAVLAPYFTSRSPVYGSIAVGDGEAAIDPNPINIGTAGTLGSNVTGSVATNYGVRTTGNLGSVVASKVARSDGPGSLQKMVWTPSAAHQLLEFYTTGAAKALNAGVQVGDVIQGAFEFEYDAATANADVNYPVAKVTFSPSNISAYSFGVNSAFFALNGSNYKGVAITPKITVPVGTTGIYLSWMFYNKTTGVETVLVGQHGLINHTRTLSLP